MMKRQRRATTSGRSSSCASNWASDDVAQRGDVGVEGLQQPDAFLALRPALAVFGARQLALGPRVADHHPDAGRDGRDPAGQMAAVQQQRAPGLPQRRAVLVQDAAVDAHEPVFRALADQRHLHRVDAEAADRLERDARRHLDGGRRAEAAGERHGAVDQAVEAGQPVAGFLQE